VSEIDAAHPVLAAIDAGGIVAIIRGDFRDDIAVIVEQLIEGGVRALEVSLTSPHALEQIEQASLVAGSRAVVGAGTVMTARDVAEASRRGGAFVVAPIVDPDVITAALDLGAVPIPGAATATEIFQAVRYGAPAVKIFPAETLGSAFVSAMRAPFPAVRLVPTGGVTFERASQFRAAGAWAVGVGSPLVSTSLHVSTLASRAAAFVGVMRPSDV
jgi:2-dehydro-3-deoxyphosphogluconate aldolase / (4S)-4-hydroxy-2-oxoglutarate aldolase